MAADLPRDQDQVLIGLENIELCIAPKYEFPYFCDQLIYDGVPDGSIFLDGVMPFEPGMLKYASDKTSRYHNFDHHFGVNRQATMSRRCRYFLRLKAG